MGTYNFAFVILNSVFPATLDITQSLAQLNSRWILQLIKGICDDFQKLLRYYSGTAIFEPINTPLLPTVAGFPKILDLYLNNVELSAVTLLELPSLVTGYYPS